MIQAWDIQKREVPGFFAIGERKKTIGERNGHKPFRSVILNPTKQKQRKQIKGECFIWQPKR